METFLRRAGDLMALAGLGLCGAAGAVRLGGGFYLLGYEAGTLFLAGAALMSAACLARLELLLRR